MFKWPCIVISFVQNNQLDASNIQNLFCYITCLKRTNRQVYSDNSWWWAQKMPETCRVPWQNKFWIFDAPSWLIYTKPINVFDHISPNSSQNEKRSRQTENLDTRFMLRTFYRYPYRLWDTRKNNVQSGMPQMTIQYGARALQAGWLRLHTHTHTLRICNNSLCCAANNVDTKAPLCFVCTCTDCVVVFTVAYIWTGTGHTKIL
jgi:hypothetical protein